MGSPPRVGSNAVTRGSVCNAFLRAPCTKLSRLAVALSRDVPDCAPYAEPTRAVCGRARDATPTLETRDGFSFVGEPLSPPPRAERKPPGAADFGRSRDDAALLGLRSAFTVTPAVAPPPAPPPLVKNEAAPRFFSAAFSASSSADFLVASRTRAAAAFAATRGSKPELDVFSLSLGREDSFSFSFSGAPTGVTPSAAKRVARDALASVLEVSPSFPPSLSSLTRYAYRSVLSVCSHDPVAGDTLAIITVREFPMNESRSTSVSFEPRNGTWPVPRSSARMHSFSANRLLLISAPSIRVWRSFSDVSAPRSLPARSMKENLP
mmetsp:Transcript_585/g.2266  ORF Transcript_585/g.2266 Transcript_585/m.2266 type:complete len:322 (+) Transcript_585:785-1750(+)